MSCRHPCVYCTPNGHYNCPFELLAHLPAHTADLLANSTLTKLLSAQWPSRWKRHTHVLQRSSCPNRVALVQSSLPSFVPSLLFPAVSAVKSTAATRFAASPDLLTIFANRQTDKQKDRVTVGQSCELVSKMRSTGDSD